MRNKKLAAIDLRNAQGQDLVRRMAAQCDIVVENFRPGGLEKWGLGYADLKRVKPDLVMVRVSGYGQDGPYSTRPGYGVVCEAVGGLRYINGEPGRPPVRTNMALTDYITGVHAAFGAMLALRHRAQTGVGQYVDTALYECAFSFLEAHIPAYEKLGVVAQPMGAGLANSAVNNLFETGDGVYVHIQGSQANGFRRVALAMMRPDLLDDVRFNTRKERAKHAAEIDAIVQEWVGARNYSEVEQVFRAAYDALPDPLRRRIANLTCVHDASRNSAGVLRKGYKEVTDPRKTVGAHHPLVRTHPVTKRKALFLGRRLNAYVPGLTLEESEALLDELWAHGAKSEFTWVQQWRTGDVIIWDNRCTMHRRDSFDAAARRLMHRTQIKGDRPH